MATNHFDPTADDTEAGRDEQGTEPPGIAHLTVVPENADCSS